MLKSKLSARFIKYLPDLLILGLISLLSPLYFYKLSQSSLSSWDEAWYGEISRNILESGNFLLLSWNGVVYADHPPVGFWIIALFEGILGTNELGVRAGSAVFGLLGLFFTYLLGKALFSRSVGLASALALSSAYWYLFRARSGNLDIFLTCLFVSTLYFAVKASKNNKFLIPFSVSAALLFLSKSLIPLTIIPALIIIFLGSKMSLKILIKPILVFLLITTPWVLAQLWYSPNVFLRYLKIGTPGVGEKTDYLANFKLVKEYLHNGIGKWFWLGVLGVLAGPLTLNKSLIVLTVFCLTFFIPFTLSNKGHIWHLVPLYPFMILSFFGFLYISSKKFSSVFFKRYLGAFNILTTIGMLLISVYYSQLQIKRSWYEFIDIPPYISDEAILSTKASVFPHKFYIDGPDFTPAAVFYSNKNVTLLPNGGIKRLLEGEEEFVLITNQWRLDLFKIPKEKYKIIASDRDKILVTRR